MPEPIFMAKPNLNAEDRCWPRAIRSESKFLEHLWIKRPNNHPAYMTEEFQEEIKVILLNNNFGHRHRSGRGRALTQGLAPLRGMQEDA